MYSNIGHDDVNYSPRVGLTKTFTDTQYVRLVLNAIQYCAGMTTSIEGGLPVSRSLVNPAVEMTVRTDPRSVSVTIGNRGKQSVTLSDAKGCVMGRASGTPASAILTGVLSGPACISSR